MPVDSAKKAADEFFETVDRLRSKYPLEVDASAKGEILELHSLNLAEEFRGQGIGRQVLQALTAAADRHAVPVELEVGYDEAEIDLMAFYSRHGFEWTGSYMRREPKPRSSPHKLPEAA